MTVKKIKIAELPKGLIDDLIYMDNELTPGTWGDGYTMNGIRAQYSDFQIEAARRLVIDPMKKELRRNREPEAGIRKKWLAKVRQ